MIKTEAYNESTQFLGLTTKNGFKAGKLYTQKPLSAADAFVVNRNLAAYRINQSGVLELMAANVPRVDYKNGCPEILIENQSTNRILQSETINNAGWFKENTTITANSIASPNGATTADTMLETAVTNTHRIEQSVTFSATTYATSVYSKYSGRQYIYLSIGGGIGTYFDIQNGTISLNVGGATSYIETLENGWYRLVMITAVPAVTTEVRVYLIETVGVLSYLGDITKGAYIWGIQIEESLSGRATSYIPTTTGTVTRPPDIIENNTINYDINQGTIFVRARLDFSTDVQGIITLYDGGPFESYITIYSEIIGGVRKIVFQTYTDPDDNTYQLTVPSDGIYNMAFAYDLTANTYAIAVNGNIEFSGTFGNITPTSSELNTLTLGRIGSFYDARVIGSMFFDSKLDNTSLENLTA
jgi:hypothetical protein